MKKQGGTESAVKPATAKVRKPRTVSKKSAVETTKSNKMAAIAAKVEKSRSLQTESDQQPIAKESPKRVETLAMMHHVNRTGSAPRIKAGFFSMKMLRVDDVLNKNWSIWLLTWAILWRGTLLVVAIKLAFALLVYTLEQIVVTSL